MALRIQDGAPAAPAGSTNSGGQPGTGNTTARLPSRRRGRHGRRPSRRGRFRTRLRTNRSRSPLATQRRLPGAALTRGHGNGLALAGVVEASTRRWRGRWSPPSRSSDAAWSSESGGAVSYGGRREPRAGRARRPRAPPPCPPCRGHKLRGTLYCRATLEVAWSQPAPGRPLA